MSRVLRLLEGVQDPCHSQGWLLRLQLSKSHLRWEESGLILSGKQTLVQIPPADFCFYFTAVMGGLPKRLVGVLSTRTSACDLIWRLHLSRGSQGKKRSLGWVLTPHDWCPCKTGKCGQRQTDAEGRPCERTMEEGGHLQAKERGLEQSLSSQALRRNQLWDTARLCDNKCPLFKLPSLWYLVVAA